MVSVDGLYPAIEMAGISPDLILKASAPNTAVGEGCPRGLLAIRQSEGVTGGYRPPAAAREVPIPEAVPKVRIGDPQDFKYTLMYVCGESSGT
jgi:hypothetical protein